MCLRTFDEARCSWRFYHWVCKKNTCWVAITGCFTLYMAAIYVTAFSTLLIRSLSGS